MSTYFEKIPQNISLYNRLIKIQNYCQKNFKLWVIYLADGLQKTWFVYEVMDYGETCDQKFGVLALLVALAYH